MAVLYIKGFFIQEIKYDFAGPKKGYRNNGVAVRWGSTVPMIVSIKGVYMGYRGRCGGLMFSALDSGLSGMGLSPGWGHCVVFLGKLLYSHSASLHPGV